MATRTSHGAPLQATPAPLPRDLTHLYSRVTKNRNATALKNFYRFFTIPGVGNVAGGLPNVQFFPFDTLEAQVARSDRWTPTPNYPSDDAGDDLDIAKLLAATKLSDPAASSHMTIPKATAEADPFKKIDLSTALQYGIASGYPPLRSFVRQFTRDHLHANVPYLNGPEVILTTGSTDGFAKTLELFLDVWDPNYHPASDRPHVLCEVFLYPSVLNQMRPKGAEAVAVEMDGQGMMTEGAGGMRDVLENWDTRNGRRPHLLYSVSMGHNPTGFVVPMERRKEIYALCCEFDIVIIEDDPYWYLQFPSAAAGEARSRGLPTPPPAEPYKPAKSSGYEFIDSLQPSYLSLDVEGRVVRLDTFSKTVAPGCRLGWITAQPAIIERFERITEAMAQQPCGFVQSMVAETIMGPQPAATTATFRALSPRDRLTFSGWQMDGWVRWLAGLRGAYERRMAGMCAILDDQAAVQLKQSTPVADTDADWGVITKTPLISFDWPRGGMFVWLRVLFEHHPLWQAKGDKLPVLDGPALATALLMFCTHKPFLVLPAPGSMFAASPQIMGERAWRYLRVCFAAETDANVLPCARRLAAAVQKFWRIKDVKYMEGLIDELNAGSVNDVDGVDNMSFPVGC